jgi:predicted PurR-regulated permease PerM
MEPAVPRDTAQGARIVRRLPPPTPRVALVIATGALLVLVALAAAGALKPFLLGVLLIYLLSPAVDRLAALRIPRGIAVLIVFAAVIAVVTWVGTIALSPLITQLQLFIKDLPQIASDLRRTVEDFYQGLRLAPDVRQAIDNALQNASSGIGALDIGGIVSPLVTSIVGLLSTIAAYAILPAWLFFLLKDRARLGLAMERALPPAWRGDVFALFAIANRVFGNWVRGQLVLGASVGILSYAGLMLLSTYVDPVFGRYAILLALVAGILELIPFIGPIIAAIPALLIGITVGPAGFVAVLALYSAIQLLENNLLVPKIQGDAVELHPSAVMLALIVGASLGGIIGAIVSLPITAAGRDMFRYAFHRAADPPASVDASLARISPKLVRAVRRFTADPGDVAASPPEPTAATVPGPGVAPATTSTSAPDPGTAGQGPSPSEPPA